MDIQYKACAPENYTRGRKESVRYLVIHYTANDGDTARGNAAYFARENGGHTSAHYFVDEKEVWQSVKEGDTAHHCGAKSYRHPHCRNHNSIGIELCSRKGEGGYVFLPQTVERAAMLTRSLMERYGLGPEDVMRHYDVTGKNCPAPFVEQPEAWADFQNRLQEEEWEMELPAWAKTTYHWLEEMPDWARSSVSKAVAQGVIDTNEDNSVTLPGLTLQTIVWMDRAGLLDTKEG